MPPQTTNTPAQPAAQTEKPDYSKNVGKYYQANHTTGLNAEAVYKIDAFVPNHNFGTAGGKKPAFKLHRQNPGGVHWEPCEQFLKAHHEVEWVD